MDYRIIKNRGAVGELIYCERKCLAEFFEESPFWEELVDCLCEGVIQYTSMDVLDTLNYIRYCGVVFHYKYKPVYDFLPAEMFDLFFEGFLSENLRQHDKMYNFFLALRMLRASSHADPDFLAFLDDLKNDRYYKFLIYKRKLGGFIPPSNPDYDKLFAQKWDLDFTPCIEKPEHMYDFYKASKEITQNFNFEIMEKILSLYEYRWERALCFRYIGEDIQTGMRKFKFDIFEEKLDKIYKLVAIPDAREIKSHLEDEAISAPAMPATEAPKKEIPEIFQTDEAKEWLEKLRQANLLDEKYQPVGGLSNAQKGLIATTLLKRLDKFNVNTQWQLVCEGLWGMVKYDSIRVAYKQVYGDNLKNLSRQNQKFLEKVEDVFED